MSILTNSIVEDNSTKTGLETEAKTGVDDVKTGVNTKVDTDDTKVEDVQAPKVADTEKSETHLSDSVNWQTSLPKTIRDNPILKNYDSHQSFLEASIKALSSDKGLEVPKVEENEKWNELFDKLGRPKKSDDYDTKDLKLIDTEDSKGLQGIKALAYELGLNQNQFDKFYKHLVDEQKQLIEQNQAALIASQKQAESDLKKEWGKEYDANFNILTRGLARVTTEKEREELESLGLGNNLTILRIFKKVGDLVKEDSVVNGSSNSVKTELERLEEWYPSMVKK